jgi:hypothetical protein
MTKPRRKPGLFAFWRPTMKRETPTELWWILALIAAMAVMLACRLY